VVVQLLSLLDLQQKEANIDEAHSSNLQTKIAVEQSKHARKQADATGAQSQILLLFTIVTIIFVSPRRKGVHSRWLIRVCQLPLSFFTSYFGMEATIVQGGNEKVSHVWKIMGQHTMLRHNSKNHKMLSRSRSCIRSSHCILL
jgi:hypothetical protein